jgi:hypothetical protein
MNKFILPLLIVSAIFANNYQYTGSTTAAVTIAGAIVHTKSLPTTEKYKRSKCPVCKGHGWYMSGDGIKKIECTYCEPELPQAITKIITK